MVCCGRPNLWVAPTEFTCFEVWLCLCGEKIPYLLRQCAISTRFTSLESTLSHHKNLCALCASVVKKSCTNPNIAPFPLTSNPRHPTIKNLCALCASVVKKNLYQPRQSAIPTDLESAPSHHKNLCALCASVVKKSCTNPNIAPFPLTSNPRPPTKTLGALGVLGGKKPVLGPANRPTPRYSSLPGHKEHEEIR